MFASIEFLEPCSRVFFDPRFRFGFRREINVEWRPVGTRHMHTPAAPVLILNDLKGDGSFGFLHGGTMRLTRPAALDRSYRLPPPPDNAHDTPTTCSQMRSATGARTTADTRLISRAPVRIFSSRSMPYSIRDSTSEGAPLIHLQFPFPRLAPFCAVAGSHFAAP